MSAVQESVEERLEWFFARWPNRTREPFLRHDALKWLTDRGMTEEEAKAVIAKVSGRAA